MTLGPTVGSSPGVCPLGVVTPGLGVMYGPGVGVDRHCGTWQHGSDGSVTHVHPGCILYVGHLKINKKTLLDIMFKFEGHWYNNPIEVGTSDKLLINAKWDINICVVDCWKPVRPVYLQIFHCRKPLMLGSLQVSKLVCLTWFCNNLH